MIGCTDGVHDNLNPEHVGLLPADIGLVSAKWEDVPYSVLEDAQSQFACRKIEELYDPTMLRSG